MRQKLFLLLVITCSLLANTILKAQTGVAINASGTNPDSSAMLDISSTHKGVLVPRMTAAQKDSIAGPATGLLIFQTDSTPGFRYYTGTYWKALSDSTLNNQWRISGNSGTSSAHNFLGTTDNNSLVFKTNNSESMRIDSIGNIGIGTTIPAYKFEENGIFDIHTDTFNITYSPDVIPAFVPGIKFAGVSYGSDTNVRMVSGIVRVPAGGNGPGAPAANICISGYLNALTQQQNLFNANVKGVNAQADSGNISSDFHLRYGWSQLNVSNNNGNLNSQIQTTDSSINLSDNNNVNNHSAYENISIGNIEQYVGDSGSVLNSIEWLTDSTVGFNTNNNAQNVNANTYLQTTKFSAGVYFNNLGINTNFNLDSTFGVNTTNLTGGMSYHMQNNTISMNIGTAGGNPYNSSYNMTNTDINYGLNDNTANNHGSLDLSDSTYLFNISTHSGANYFYNNVWPGSYSIGISGPSSHTGYLNYTDSTYNFNVSSPAYNSSIAVSRDNFSFNLNDYTYGNNSSLNLNTGNFNVAVTKGGQTGNLYLTDSTLYVVSSGRPINFGVNNSTPQYSVDVTGSMRATNLSGGGTLVADASGQIILAALSSSWNLTGNSGTIDGTNFIGTTDNVPLTMRVNNQPSFRIDPTSQNTFFGYQAGINQMYGYYNLFIGYQAGYTTSSGAAVNDHYIGYQAGYSTTSGNSNHFDGYQAGYYNDAGSQNEFVGYQAGYENNSGTNNLFFGFKAGWNNTYNSQNQFIGFEAGFYNVTGNNNQFDGYRAGYNNYAGSNNLFEGYQAGQNSNGGSYDIEIGYNAAATNQNGSNDLIIGYQADVATDGLLNATAIGYQAVVGASNSLVLGGTGANAVYTGTNTTTPNSRFQVNGSFATTVNAYTGNYTVTDNDAVLKGDATGGSFIFQLPDAIGIQGRQYTFKKMDNTAGTISVAPAGSETIDGVALYLLGTQWKYVTIVSDGANWIVTANN